jgi:signal peptidase II
MKSMRNVWRLALVGTLLLCCVGCDQASKGIARAKLALGESHTFLGDTFRLIHVENNGAFLGIGANLPDPLRIAVFQGAIGLLILGLLWAAAFRRETGAWQVVGFTLLAASGIGNLIDRLLFDGRVTDFLNIGVGSWRTGIFNIADIAGMVGFVILLLANVEATPSDKSLERTRGR